ncbi:MAG: hypothetical protein CL933_10265 [Deltaproteobacteria bacterium]|nr:hypothetical protein [Deltaproteobacteria bacterium]
MESKAVFEEDVVLATARREAGLADFGDIRFREPLRRLLHSLEHEALLSEAGRTIQFERVIGNLVTRFWAEAFIARHPEILEEEIEAPVVVVGPIRSGTTRLQRLLGEDPRHLAVLWWENRCPVPLPGSDWRRDDPRIPRQWKRSVRRLRHLLSSMRSTHGTLTAQTRRRCYASMLSSLMYPNRAFMSRPIAIGYRIRIRPPAMSSSRVCSGFSSGRRKRRASELERIYDWLGAPFPSRTRSALEIWLVRNAREKRPAHRYCLEDFGLEEGDLKRQFADYRECFILSRPS